VVNGRQNVNRGKDGRIVKLATDGVIYGLGKGGDQVPNLLQEDYYYKEAEDKKSK
jgi:hypothetical protein